MTAWQPVRLGRVIRPRSVFTTIDEERKYKLCRVQTHARGIVLREIAQGIDIKTKRQQICKKGDFLVAEIDAKVGGFGIVPDELDGAIVSSHYFLYDLDINQLDSRFLEYFIRTSAFQNQVTAQGSTNYAAIRPDDVLDYTIPLPDLPEQQRIVARIEALAGKIEEARRLRGERAAASDQLLRSLVFGKSDAFPKTPMSQIVKRKDVDVSVEPSKDYHFAGVYSFGRGVFKGEVKNGSQISYRSLSQVSQGDFIYPKLMAWEGALGAVPAECDGLYVSPEFPVFLPDIKQVLPCTLDIYFRTPTIWPNLAEISAGTNVRRRRLHPEAFLKYVMPLPPMSVQMQLQRASDLLQLSRKVDEASATDLESLLPAILDRAFKGEL